MKKKKIKCPYCKKMFDPKPNQLYCKYACKMVSFWIKKAKEKK